MNSTDVKDVWTFDDFRPGDSLGGISVVIDAERLGKWQKIYGDLPADGVVPRGLLVACMMEAYLALVAPRPPGNIHASQKLSFSTAHAQLGDTLSMTANCLEKTLRKGRGWVTFEVVIAVESVELLRGEIRTVWAK
jgi:hypothetical protein